MIVLGIETSCDETAAAVLEIRGAKDRPRILSNLIASQDEIHTPYGGIVPELASRRHIEILQPMTEQALKEAKVPPAKLDGIAVTHAPGLVGSLLVGLSFAKGLAFSLQIPFVGVSHLEGHLNAPYLEYPKIPYPQIGLIVSGGHTALYFIRRFGDYQFLGGTRDDAAGEAFDKVAKILGLGYPGGPMIDRLAKEGDPTAVKLPRPQMPKYDFSFSGLKTAVKNMVGRIPEGCDSLRKPAIGLAQSPLGRRLHSRPAGHHLAAVQRDSESFPWEPHSLRDACASFQEVVVDHLIEKTLKAVRAKRCKTVLLAGGVACNSRLREKFQEELTRTGGRLYHSSPRFCTDNAAMIALTGGRHLLAGRRSPLSLNAFANLDLKNVQGERE